MAGPSANKLSIDLPHDYFAWTGTYQKADWHPWFDQFNSVEALIDKGESPEIIVLSVQAEEQDKWLVALRQHELTSLSLVLVLRESALSPFLANGLWGEEYQQQYQSYKLKREQIKLDFTDDAAYRLLCYLWCNQDATLEPHAVPAQRYLYDYPLLNAWGISPGESFIWLNHLQKNNWIERVELNNRIRLCPCCHSGHLNYIDVCPQCHGIEIEQQSSLHCFNCGHVGAQVNFRKFNTLSCPNCLQNLRHIGVDYDRPIENQRCNACQTLFVEPIVEAECLHCKSSNKLDDLHVQNIASFKLTEEGRSLVRQGISQSSYGLAPGEQMVSAQFHWLVDWQNKLAKRHHLTHVILSVEMLNVAQLLSTDGEAKGFARLDALQDRLRSMVRVTDACSSYTRDGLLLLLPMTAPGQLKAIYKKFAELEELQPDSRIELCAKAITLPADINSDIGDWLTDQFLRASPL